MPQESNRQIDTDENDEFLAYFNDSGLPHPDNWPQESPVFVTASQRAPQITYNLPQSDSIGVSPFPLDGSVVEFSGPLFSGKIVSRMKDVPSMSIENQSPPLCPSDEYFKGRSRLFQWTVQGVFSKRCRFDKVLTGQYLDRPFRNTPSSSLVKRGLDLMKNRLPDTFVCDLLTEEPKFEHPLICGCQYFRVDKISSLNDVPSDRLLGEGPKGEIVEDCALLGEEVPSNSEKRRKFFCKQENLERYYFETDFIYTFDFYANFFSPARHRLEITPFFSFDLIPYFNGQPLFMAMAKEKDSDEYLWGTEVWHKRLLDAKPRQGVLKRIFVSSKSSKNNEKK